MPSLAVFVAYSVNLSQMFECSPLFGQGGSVYFLSIDPILPLYILVSKCTYYQAGSHTDAIRLKRISEKGFRLLCMYVDVGGVAV